ncbi:MULTISPECIES: putative PEP-binding protein [Pseudonocardia]|uniref:Phosphoenolpyruvate-protein phosphotransferase n=2 Tax=Pseudonocardia TaxID=1847 RepID=A0A1Y2N234_PSEAH|nr:MULTISPECIES: putative PEP-binding protein [Pseudonocardia]OSY41177.1 Phosphoenolpyruvate-protein phosphotransferase [Pseudonocardia autotrophica]TDN76633.1 phosphoenolpyruvate--protein phosphotransferase [Pseudonocardia autotrophica]BBG00633.1 phosphoenolpyruvate-protein phosphotransferase [Pseudonocardia autotrophica]GEC28013.1 phosphoenolpyruvate-protein phosphotransferase [Pseudonocardia saturnea]
MTTASHPVDAAAGVLAGRGVSPGVVCAPLARLAPPPATSSADPVGADTGIECARIDAALEAVAADLHRRTGTADPAAAGVLEATAAMALDPTLAAAAHDRVRAGTPTAHAVTLAVEEVCTRLAGLGGYLAERATDVRDVGHRTVAHLLDVPPPGLPAPGHPVVLTAPDLSPADTAALAGSDVVALLTEQGGPTSHTAIIARALGLPAVVGCAQAAFVDPGTIVLLDGGTGVVQPDPPPAARVLAVGRRAAGPAAATGPGRTADGIAVPLLSNIGTEAQALAAAAGGSEGIGLLRTEFLFLDRTTAPTRTEQRDQLTRILRAFGSRRVVVRTLDAGSDKPLPFLPLGDEANPALGVRGLRTAAGYPQMLAEQLHAIGEAAERAGREIDVMAPMVATADEAARFAGLARAAGAARAGAMVEVPAAALRARELCAAVDFVSIGTNDLGQYVMAADRTIGSLGDLLDPWQPALLDLVGLVGEAGRATGTPVGVCGEAAADPQLAVVLVGLGATSLSTAPPARDAVAAELARHDRDTCRRAADLARSATDAAGARAAVAAFLDRT